MPLRLSEVQSLILTGFASACLGGIACGGSIAPSSDESGHGGSTSGSGGSTNVQQGGATAVGGSTGGLDCSHVTCPALPATCTQIGQPAGSCCAECLANPCTTCSSIACAAGTHLEILAGECCPQCVVDAPTACETAQTNYAAIRAQMIEKYSSVTCSNSSECVIVAESNACAWTCGYPIATSMADSLKSNLDSIATQSCATCPAPTPVLCELMVPACFNGKCVAADPS
jgi:hypothetical protein